MGALLSGANRRGLTHPKSLKTPQKIII